MNHGALELPLTTTYWGMLRRQGDFIFPRLWRMPAMRGVLARLGLLMVLPPYQVAPIYPAAGWGLAVLLVAMRRLRAQYQASPLYRGA